MRKFIWVLLILAVAVGIIISLASYGYGSVGVNSSGNSTLIFEYEGDVDSLRDLLKPDNVAIETTVDVHNNSIVPVYIPALEHNLSLNDRPLCDTVYTPSIWLGPWGNATVPVSANIPGNALPRVMLQYIQEYVKTGGSVDVKVQSTARIAGITLTRTQTVPFEMVMPKIAVRVT
ncbi:MAG: hypothetical protein JSW38_06015 [Dehalococcoidia bacterium]|nr:MAG: hypothetical protein JSV02_02870 [Dehalococcoidia bacterium]UCG84366.1 MAG: hypothetical protein JSW38_06015 [Dehalococcoidia bacterium]